MTKATADSAIGATAADLSNWFGATELLDLVASLTASTGQIWRSRIGLVHALFLRCPANSNKMKTNGKDHGNARVAIVFTCSRNVGLQLSRE